MEKNRYYRSTSGFDPLIYVASSLTTEPTLQDLQNNGAVGEFGFFTFPEGVLIDDNTAIPDDQKVVIAVIRQKVKNGGENYLETSQPLLIKKPGVGKVDPAPSVLHQITVTQVATPTVLETGNGLYVSLIETTPGNQPFPRWDYGIEALPGETRTQLIARLVAQINNDFNPVNNGERLVEAAVVGGTGFSLTALEVGRFFRLAITGEAGVYNYTWAVTQQFSYGAGNPDQVKLFQFESDIKKGVTHQYPIQALPHEFGLPLDQVDPAATYTSYTFITQTSEWSPTPVDKHFRKNYTMLFTLSSVAALATYVDVAVGLVEPTP